MTRRAPHQSGRTHGRARRGGGFSLIELSVAVAITAVLIVAMGSSIVLVTNALPNGQSPVTPAIETGAVLEQVANELQYATYITERSAHSIAFTVADRDGNGVPESIRYDWSSVEGEPLTRRYNGGAPVTVLSNVKQFDLAFDTRTVDTQYPGPLVEGAEQVLASYDPAGGPVNPSEYKVDKDQWPGQYFKPTMPPDAVSWSLTKVKFMAKEDGSSGESVSVELWPANASNTPSGAAIESVVVPESSFYSSNFRWEQVAFSSVKGRTPGSGLCMVLANAPRSGVAGRIRYDNNAGAGLLDATNSGAVYTYVGDESLLYYIYGKITTPTPDQIARRQYVTSARITLATADVNAPTLTSSVSTLNTPELLAAVWDVDFTADPTTIDLNGDGQADWATASDGAFNSASLSGGVWNVDNDLRAKPDNDYRKLTTIEMRCRDTTSGDPGPAFWFNVDWAGTTHTVFLGDVTLQSDSTQTFTLLTSVDGISTVPVVTVTGLPSDFVDVQFVIDPAANTISVTVAGTHRGTYTYSRFSNGAPRRVGPYAAGTGAQFDYFRVRVSE